MAETTTTTTTTKCAMSFPLIAKNYFCYFQQQQQEQMRQMRESGRLRGENDWLTFFQYAERHGYIMLVNVFSLLSCCSCCCDETDGTTTSDVGGGGNDGGGNAKRSCLIFLKVSKVNANIRMRKFHPVFSVNMRI